MSDAIDDNSTTAAARNGAAQDEAARNGKPSNESAANTNAGADATAQDAQATHDAQDSGAAGDDVETEAFALNPTTGEQEVLDSYTAPDDDAEMDGGAMDLSVGANSEDADSEDADSEDADSDDADDSADAHDAEDSDGAGSGSAKSRGGVHLTDYVAQDNESRSRGAGSYDPQDYDADGAEDEESEQDAEYQSMRNQFSTAFDLIDDLIDEVNKAPGGVFNRDMARINRTNLVDELTNLKKLLPVQLSHASNLMRQANYRLDDAQTEANSIVSDAKAKAAKIISAAEDRAEFLAGQENVVAIANDKARAIMSKAQEKADKLTIGADQYCEDVMGELAKQLQHVSASVNEGIRVIGERKAAAQGSLEELNAQLAQGDEQE